MPMNRDASVKLSCLAMAVFPSMYLAICQAQNDANAPMAVGTVNTPAQLDPNSPAPTEAGAGENGQDANPKTQPQQGIPSLGDLKDWAVGDQPQSRDRSTTELFLRSMGALLIVVALMVVALSLSKRIMPKLGRNAGKEIKIIETTVLGPRKYLHVVRVANQRLLLGSTNDRINMLAHLVDDLAGLDIEPSTEQKEV